MGRGGYSYIYIYTIYICICTDLSIVSEQISNILYPTWKCTHDGFTSAHPTSCRGRRRRGQWVRGRGEAWSRELLIGIFAYWIQDSKRYPSMYLCIYTHVYIYIANYISLGVHMYTVNGNIIVFDKHKRSCLGNGHGLQHTCSVTCLE